MSNQFANICEEFIVDDIHSGRYGLFVISTDDRYDEVDTGISYSISTTTGINGLNFVEEIKDEGFKFELKVTRYYNNTWFPLDDDFVKEINMWLLKKKQRKLIIGDKIYYGYFTSCKRTFDRYLTYSFEMPNSYCVCIGERDIICDGNRDIQLKCIDEIEEYSYLEITIDNIKSEDVIVKNISNNIYFQISNLKEGQKIKYFCDTGEIYNENDDNENIYANLIKNKNMILNHGFNRLKIQGKCHINFKWYDKVGVI